MGKSTQESPRPYHIPFTTLSKLLSLGPQFPHRLDGNGTTFLTCYNEHFSIF